MISITPRFGLGYCHTSPLERFFYGVFRMILGVRLTVTDIRYYQGLKATEINFEKFQILC